SWVKVGVPLSVSLAAILYVTLTFVTCRFPTDLVLPVSEPGRRARWSTPEKLVALVFCLTVLAWGFRTTINFSEGAKIVGWLDWIVGRGFLPTQARAFVT